jgi:ribonuclease HI
MQMAFDSGSRGKPTEAAAGVHLNSWFSDVESNNNSRAQSKRETTSIREYLGTGMTNNQAGFQGVLSGLQQAFKTVQNLKKKDRADCQVTLEIQSDCKLIINQLSGDVQCRSKNLKPLHTKTQSILSKFQNIANIDVSYHYVPRKENSKANGEST